VCVYTHTHTQSLFIYTCFSLFGRKIYVGI